MDKPLKAQPLDQLLARLLGVHEVGEFHLVERVQARPLASALAACLHAVERPKHGLARRADPLGCLACSHIVRQHAIPGSGTQHCSADRDARHRANCKAPLPADWPSDNHYCAKCNVAWQQGQTARQTGDADRE